MDLSMEAVLESEGGEALRRTLHKLARKPRVLVCAPSNAAVDVVLERVMARGFVQGDGSIYKPNVVRVGAEDANVSAVVRQPNRTGRICKAL